MTSRSALRLSPQRPTVPRAVRPAFTLAALGVLSSWSIMGLFLSLGPELSGVLFHSGDHLVGSVSVVALATSAALATVAFRRTDPWRGAATGPVALAAGMLAIVAATSIGSGSLYLAGSVIAGAGFGVAFLGSLRALSESIPAEHRAAVMSAFYVVAYTSLSLPAILAGMFDTPLGLRPTFEIFGSLAAALALGVAVQAQRIRPRRDDHDSRMNRPALELVSQAPR